MRVGLFVPCYIDQLFPKAGLATAELLERYGCAVEYPEAQTCCGQPMANAGFFSDAEPVARHFAETFAGYEAIVCPSGSCTSMVRNHYPKDLRLPVYELCEFLHDVLHVEPLGAYPHKVGLHQSCHGMRELRLSAGPERFIAPFDKVRALLERLQGIELVPLERPGECCGFGGTFSVSEEAVSCAMGRDRLDDHQRAGAEVITATDASCLMHLDGLIRREARPLRVLHVAELLAEATR